jgi:NADH-quinone oxidoreductase subunit E
MRPLTHTELIMELSQETLDKIDARVAKYPTKRSAALPLLHLIQEEKGYVPDEAVEWIAQRLELEPINIYEILTFYPMLKRSPMGRKHVRVCRTLSCALRGGYQVCKTLQEQLGCKLDSTSANGDFSIEFVECLASCGTAPVVMVNETHHENMDEEKTILLCRELKKNVNA